MIVSGTSYLVLNVPPLVLQEIGLLFLASSRPFGTCSFLINVLLQPVSISTLGSLFGVRPVMFFTRAETSVINP